MLTTSCNTGKQLMKEAAQLEEGGLRNEAYDKYDDVYQEYGKAEALIGMRRVAQSTLNSKLTQAQLYCLSKNYEASLAAYEDAFAYSNQHSELELHLSPDAQDKYNSCKNEYIDELYNEAEQAVYKDDYTKAQQLIRSILAIDRRNQKAQYLEMMCEVLPNYNAGKKAAELGLWREAYVYFDEVCRIDAGFKDAVPMRNECLAKGAFTVAYIITDNKQAGNNMEEALAATIKGELLKSENPFLELLERENLAVVIKEQQQTLSPEFDNENSNLGKLKKAQFILSGELVHFKSEVTPVEKRKCDCATTLGIADEKVICYEVTQNRMLNASFKYQLIDAETGKLYLSDVISFADQDYSKKHEYEIQKKLSLLSPTFTKDHDVNLNGMKQTTPDVLLTEQDLLLRMYASFANKVSSALSHFSP